MLRICLYIACSLPGLIGFSQEKPVLPIPALLQLAKSSPTDTGRMDYQLQAAYAYVRKPGEDTVDLDSALLLIDQVRAANRYKSDPRIQGLCYLVYSSAWWERNKHDVAKQYAQQAIAAFEKLDDRLDLAYAYVKSASYYSIDYADQLEERIRLYRLAAPIFDSAGKKEMQASTLELLGDCINATNQGIDVLPVLLQALKIYRSIGHTDLENLYSLLGKCYAESGDARNALTYVLLAVRQEEEHGGPGPGLCTAYNRLGLTYFRFQDYKNAEDAFAKAVDVAALKDTADIRVVTCNLVSAKSNEGKYRSALKDLEAVAARYPSRRMEDAVNFEIPFLKLYSSIGYLDSARPYFEQLLRIHETLSVDDFTHHRIDPPIIYYMLATHQYDQVSRFVSHFRSFSRQMHDPARLVNDYYYLFLADSTTGDFKTAVTDYQRYSELKDSLASVVNSKQVASLKLDYETEKKDKDIALLTREQETNRSALHQAGLVRNAVIGGSFMLLVLLGVSYNRYRIKQRSNSLLELQKLAIDKKNLELQQLNLSQGKLLKEKEWLLKEIHHRVKNNLQIAMSLLNTQTYYLDNEKAVEAIRQSRNRMFAMSLIHQRLYQSDNLELIHMDRYIPELIDYIEDSVARDRNISFRTQIDCIRLDVAQAVPIGLIVNEAVTNSIKYAFPHRDGGCIDILLNCKEENSIFLQIADNGVGVKPDFDIRKEKSMGMQLIDTLNEQLDGTMTMENHNGLVISIVLKKFA
jgi:two-component sensor histidine kinase